ncbi:MAG: PDZ domain-containing protein [Candidatus Promineifilaceae bacterium]
MEIKKQRKRFWWVMGLVVTAAAVTTASVYAFYSAETNEPATYSSNFALNTDYEKYEAGVLVSGVDPDGAAAAAGIRRGTIILSINGTTVNSIRDLHRAMDSQTDGETVAVEVYNGPEAETLSVTLPEGSTIMGIELTTTTIEHDFDFTVEGDLISNLTVLEVFEGSAAEAAGIQAGDVIKAIDGNEMTTFDDLIASLSDKQPNDSIEVTITRDGAELALNATLGEHPNDGERAYLGVETIPSFIGRGFDGGPFIFEMDRFGDDFLGGEGLLVVEVVNGSSAETAGLQAGDWLKSAENSDLKTTDDLITLLADKQPGDTLTFTLERDGEAVEQTVTLGEHPDDANKSFLGIQTAPHIEIFDTFELDDFGSFEGFEEHGRGRFDNFPHFDFENEFKEFEFELDSKSNA